MRRAALAVLALLVLALSGCGAGPAVDAPTEPTTSAAATTTRATTTRATPTTTTPPPPPPAQTFEGRGDDVVELAAPLDFGVMTFECPGCDSNVIVSSDGEGGLINEIGSYAGKRWLGVRGDVTSQFEIQADGAWTLTAGGLDDRLTA